MADGDDKKKTYFYSHPHDLPHKRVATMREMLWRDDGPDDERKERVYESVDGRVVVKGRSVTTLPRRAPDAPRDGDPIVDHFQVAVHQNGMIAALCKGTSWSARSLEAAQRACEGFVKYCERAAVQAKQLQDAGHAMQRAVASAHDAVIFQKQDIWDSGTTTLVGGVLVKFGAGSPGSGWGFMCANVGDCKAYLYSEATKEVVDITDGSRDVAQKPFDTCGRIGPYKPPGGNPDLRNFRLYFIGCEKGDKIILLSRGVHENLDPRILGLKPQDFKIVSPTWGELPTPDSEVPKQGQGLKAMQKTEAEMKEVRKAAICQGIKKIVEDADGEPDLIADRFIEHVWKVTEKSRSFLEENPSKRLPTDPTEYPGKLDHASALVLEVGFLRSKTDEHLLVPESGLWEWRAFIPVVDDESRFDLFAAMTEKNASMGKVIDAAARSLEVRFQLNLYEPFFDLSEKVPFVLQMKVRLRALENKNIEFWTHGREVKVTESTDKASIAAVMQQYLEDNQYEEEFLGLIEARLQRFLPDKDTLELRGSRRALRFGDFGPEFERLSGDLTICQSDIEVFGEGNGSLGTFRTLHVRGNSPEFIEEFVSQYVKPQPEWSIMSLPEFLGTLRNS